MGNVEIRNVMNQLIIQIKKRLSTWKVFTQEGGKTKMRYKIVEVALASKTVNVPADPTQITKKIEEKIVGEAKTFEEAQEIVEKMNAEEEEAYDMSLAMCGGDSELMGPQDITERYVFDTVEQKVFQLGFVDDGVEYVEGYGEVPCTKVLLMPIEGISSVSEIHTEGWQM